MENINTLATGTIALVTVIIGAGVIATYFSQFIKLSTIGILSSQIIYIVIVLSFILWLRRKLK